MIDMGDVENTNIGSGSNQYITVTYDAVVENILSNQ
jgi:hypothetical protein